MSSETERSARLATIAAVRAILEDRADDLAHLVEHTDDPREAFHAAAGMAASLVRLLPRSVRGEVLAQLTKAAVEQ